MVDQRPAPVNGSSIVQRWAVTVPAPSRALPPGHPAESGFLQPPERDRLQVPRDPRVPMARGNRLWHPVPFVRAIAGGISGDYRMRRQGQTARTRMAESDRAWALETLTMASGAPRYRSRPMKGGAKGENGRGGPGGPCPRGKALSGRKLYAGPKEIPPS